MTGDSTAAVPLLEQFLQETPRDDSRRASAIRYLVVMLESRGDHDDAMELLQAAVEDEALGRRHRGALAFELASLYARRGDETGARQMYSRVIDLDATLAEVYLNRANLLVRVGELAAAHRDYERYMTLRPENPQQREIREMMRLITEELLAEEIRQQQEEEARRIAEEERRRREEEEQRIAEEQRRAEEEAQRIAEEERREREEEERRIAEAQREAEEAARRIAEEERRIREAEERRIAEERRQQMLQSVMDSLGAARSGTRAAEIEGEGLRMYDDDLDILD